MFSFRITSLETFCLNEQLDDSCLPISLLAVAQGLPDVWPYKAC